MLPKSLRPLIPYFKKYRRSYVVGTICVFLTNGIWILFPLVIRRAVDDLHLGITRHKLVTYALLLLAVAGIKGIFQFLTRSIVIGVSTVIASGLIGITLGLLGVAFLGGWLEQMSGFTEGSRLAMVGIISSLIMPSEAVWRRAAFEMESPLAGSLQFSPFADVSIPSIAMIVYASSYLLVALAIAVYHFGERDL